MMTMKQSWRLVSVLLLQLLGALAVEMSIVSGRLAHGRSEDTC
jgi:hypothetical protein